MRRLILLSFILLSCAGIDTDTSLMMQREKDLPVEEEEVVKPKIPVLEDYSLPNCKRQVVIIGYNCWVIWCDPPCTPKDYDCFSGYCEGIDDGTEPRE